MNTKKTIYTVKLSTDDVERIVDELYGVLREDQIDEARKVLNEAKGLSEGVELTILDGRLTMVTYLHRLRR